MAEVDAEQRRPATAGPSSAARSSVPSPPSTTTSSQPSAAAGPCGDDRRRPAASSSAASSASTRTLDAGRRRTAAAASRTARSASARPVCPTSRTHVASAGHDGPAATAASSRAVVERRRAPTQPQEVLDVARRPGQRAGGHAGHTQPELVVRRRRHRRDRVGPQLRLADDAAGAEPLAPTSNCGLTIGTRSASGAGDRDQRGQHQAQRDEGQVGDHQVDRLARPWQASGRGRWCGPRTRTRSSVCSDQASWP